MKCIVCDCEATLLCDAAIALVDGGKRVKERGRAEYAVTTMEDMLSVSYTCNAPMCAAHARVVGHIRGHATIDRCHGCCSNPRGRLKLMTPDQIDSHRTKLHAKYRRDRIRAVT